MNKFLEICFCNQLVNQYIYIYIPHNDIQKFRNLNTAIYGRSWSDDNSKARIEHL